MARPRVTAWAAVVVGIGFIGIGAIVLSARIRDYDEGVYWQSVRALARGGRYVFTGQVYREKVDFYPAFVFGKEAIITLSSPQGSDNVDPWRKVTDSFAWGP